MRLKRLIIILPFIVIVFMALGVVPVVATTSIVQNKEAANARGQIAASKVALNQATAEYAKASSRAQAIDDKIKANETQLKNAQYKLAAVRVRFNKRIVAYYKTGSAGPLTVLASSRTYNDFTTKLVFVSRILELDVRAASKVRSLENRLKRHKTELTQAKNEQAKQLAIAKKRQTQIQQKLRIQNALLASLKNHNRTAGAAPTTKVAMARTAAPKPVRQRYTSRGDTRGGFVFPVAGPNSFIDSWGFARSGGRRHKGCDIMATRGTPVVACVSGVIERTSPYSHGSGGITIYLAGNNGDSYYYAHLDRIEGGVAPGTRVSAGQVIGYVGETGNASTPHLHFEIHPGGGAPVNPYPTLRDADR